MGGTKDSSQVYEETTTTFKVVCQNKEGSGNTDSPRHGPNKLYNPNPNHLSMENNDAMGVDHLVPGEATDDVEQLVDAMCKTSLEDPKYTQNEEGHKDNAEYDKSPSGDNSDQNQGGNSSSDNHHSLKREKGAIAAPRTQNYLSPSTEPFPDYYESCEANIPVVDRAHEEAYNYAISKVVEEVIRSRQVDSQFARLTTTMPPHIASSAASPPISPSMANIDPALRGLTFPIHGEAQEQSELPDSKPAQSNAAGKRPARNLPPLGNLSNCTGSSGLVTVPTTVGSEVDNAAARKQAILSRFNEILQSECLGDICRNRFTDLRNTVLRMEQILFQHFPSNPEQFLCKKDTKEVKLLADRMHKYASSVEGYINEQLKNSHRVRYIVNEIDKLENTHITVKFKQMSKVITSNSKIPRPIEQAILAALQELYNRFVYADFLAIYNRQINREGRTIPARVELCRLITKTWDSFGRVLVAYGKIVDVTLDIKNRFVHPTLMRMSQSPRIWQDCLMRQQAMLQRKERDREASVRRDHS